jgi:hypothetical protein
MIFYDITGTHPDLLEENKQHVVFQSGQIIEFYTPVFTETIVVEQSVSGSWVELALGTDYEITSEFEDDNGISEAKIIDGNFSPVWGAYPRLVNKLRMLKWDTVQYTIRITCQKLRSNMMDYAVREGIPDEYNPLLIADLIAAIRYLESVNGGSGGFLGVNLDGIALLKLDRTGIYPDNHIIDELHQVDVPNHRQLVRPGAGAFYAHEVVVKLESTDEVLVENVDYLVIGCNKSKTRVCEHSSGVFDYIYLLREVVGNVKVSYHAFGGEPGYADIENIKTAITNILKYLQDANFMDADALPGHPYIRDINDRLVAVIQDFNTWKSTLSDVPSYTFTTSTVDGVLHWYDIATLYKKNPDDGHIHVKDSALFRIELRWSNLVFDVNVTVNLTDDSNEKFDIKVIQSTCPGEKLYTKDYSNLFEDYLVPSIRAVTVRKDTGINDGWNTGIVFQLGLALTDVHDDSGTPCAEDVIIEHQSHTSSEIYLKTTTGGIVGPNDNSINMPDETSVWIAGADYPNKAVEFRRYTGFDDGVFIWGGAIPLHVVKNAPISLIPYASQYSFDGSVNNLFSNITQLKYVLLDRHDGHKFVVYSDPLCGTPGFTAIVHMPDFVSLTTNYTTHFGVPHLDISSGMGKHSELNERFVLLQIYAMFEREQSYYEEDL